MAVDTLGHLLALVVTAANDQKHAQVAALAEATQGQTGQSVEVAGVDWRCTGPEPAEAAEKQGIRLEVARLPEAKTRLVLLPRRWVVERSFGRMARFRRLARDYERLPGTLAGLHFVAFAVLMLVKFGALNQNA